MCGIFFIDWEFKRGWTTNIACMLLQDRSSATLNRKRHWLVEQKLLHFVDAFHQYVMDRVISFSTSLLFFMCMCSLFIKRFSHHTCFWNIFLVRLLLPHLLYSLSRKEIWCPLESGIKFYFFSSLYARSSHHMFCPFIRSIWLEGISTW